MPKIDYDTQDERNKFVKFPPVDGVGSSIRDCGELHC